MIVYNSGAETGLEFSWLLVHTRIDERYLFYALAWVLSPE